MPRRVLERIRDAIRSQRYDVTKHAVDEMAEDGLDIVDVETAIVTGSIAKTEKDDPRGRATRSSALLPTASPGSARRDALQRPADISSLRRTR